MTPEVPLRVLRACAPRALAATITLLVTACSGASHPDPTEAEVGLHRAARDGDVDRLRAALRAGADPDSRDADGRTALVVAAQHGSVGAVQALVAAGADLDHALRGPGNALEAAERAGHAEVAAALLRAGARSSGKPKGD